MSKQKSFLLAFSCIGKSCPTVTELQSSKGSISRPADRFVRFLGALQDENLSFKRHIDSMRLKASWGLGILRKQKRVFPFSILRLLFFSILRLFLLNFWRFIYYSYIHIIYEYIHIFIYYTSLSLHFNISVETFHEVFPGISRLLEMLVLIKLGTRTMC